jgi:hypothetical protein
VGPLPETARGRPAKDGLQDTSPAAIVADRADIAAVLALSDERDTWMCSVDQAYRDGFNDGQATACITLAVMEEHREKRQRWNEWRAKVSRIITSCDHPDSRRRQVEAEIAADQLIMASAKERARTKPGSLSPLEWCVLNRIRLERLDESEAV